MSSNKNKPLVPGQKSLFSFFSKPPTAAPNNENVILNNEDIATAHPETVPSQQPTAPQPPPSPPTIQTTENGTSEIPTTATHFNATVTLTANKPPSLPIELKENEDTPADHAAANIYISHEEQQHVHQEELSEDTNNSEAKSVSQANDDDNENDEEEEEEDDDDDIDGPNEYEMQRLARIQRNMEVMRSLGLGPQSNLYDLDGSQKNKKKNKSGSGGSKGKAVSKRKLEPQLPLRRSSRQRGTGAAADLQTDKQPDEKEEQEEEEEPPPVYDDSSVHRYVCNITDQPHKHHQTPPPQENATISGFTQLPTIFTDSALAKAYSIDWRPGLVVAAGKDGHASIWGTQTLKSNFTNTISSKDDDEDSDDVEPLLSCRLHRSWISDIQFLSTSNTGTTCTGSSIQEENPGEGLILLSAANDGTICVWDLSKSIVPPQSQCHTTTAMKKSTTSRALPKLVYKASNLHASGIFSMHECARHILTASKDKSVVHSTLLNTGEVKIVKDYEDIHDGVVKCARWLQQPQTTTTDNYEPVLFASCGNDRVINITDTRTGKTEVTLEGHSTAVNCIQWSPLATLDGSGANQLIVSSSHDPTMLVHDVRKPNTAVFEFVGHSTERHRIGSIYQPVFVDGGDAVVVGCERNLRLYCCKSGGTISRGEIDCVVGAMWSGGGKGDMLFCSSNRAVLAFAPTWKKN